ncbi:MAG: LarC family nickel insertion protein [Clostridiales bacterium]|nr:LarC family nickel insertion protein [Clostridiales bacterium]
MNESILYLECNSGISGDMAVAALLDLGADRQVLLDALKSLPLSGYSIEIKDVYKSGIRACDFHVILDAEHENHDHDMEYLHGSGHVHEAHAREHNAEGASAELLPESIHAETACQHTNETHSHTHSHVEETCTHSHMDDGHMHSHTHSHTEEACAHSHAGNDHAHSHHARNLQDIVEIIRAGDLSTTAADLAIRIFEIVAKAEAKVHGKSINEVHFHEVGAVDSIVDIVAAAVCLDNLHPDQVVVSALTEGCGQIRCQHGLIPIPVPAVTAIAEQEDLVLHLTDIQGELVTPTGAAIAAAVRTKEKLPEQFRIRRVGLGAGKRAYATAGVLRAMLVEPSGEKLPSAPAKQGSSSMQTYTFRLKNLHCQQGIPAPAEANSPKHTATSAEPDSLNHTATSAEPDSLKCIVASAEPDATTDSAAQAITDTNKCPDNSADAILVLETNIDDCTGEAVAFTMQQLLEAGALDVFSIPIYMKKNRPAWLLKTICEPKDREVLEAIIFQNTTTIGIRRQTMQRTKLPRKIVTVETDWGVADIKCCDYGQTMRYFPENDSVSRLAVENGIGFPEMYRLLQEFAQKHLSGTAVFS